jgi:hypothetical protein
MNTPHPQEELLTNKSALADAIARELAADVVSWDVAAGDLGETMLAEVGRCLDAGAAVVSGTRTA